jgi:hypothetical protein
MVRRIVFLVFAGLAVAAAACGGGGSSTPPPAQPRSTSTPTRPASGPTLSLEPRSGPPGSVVTLTGSGWPSGVKVDLTGKVAAGVKATPYTTVITDSSGGFVASFRLEKTPDGKDLQVGRFDLIARSSTVQVDISFLVESRRPIFGPGPGG